MKIKTEKSFAKLESLKFSNRNLKELKSKKKQFKNTKTFLKKLKVETLTNTTK